MPFIADTFFLKAEKDDEVGVEGPGDDGTPVIMCRFDRPVLTSAKVIFAPGSHEVDPVEIEKIRDLASFCATMPHAKSVRVEGFAGSAESVFNIADMGLMLASLRTTAVCNVLEATGIGLRIRNMMTIPEIHLLPASARLYQYAEICLEG